MRKRMTFRGRICLGLSMILSATALFPLAALANGNKLTFMYINGAAGDIASSEVDKANGAFDVVSPLMFEVNLDGTLRKKTIYTSFINNMHAQGIKVVPHISNHWGDNVTNPKGNEALAQYDLLAEQVVAEVENYNLDGLNVDIENADHTHRDQYTAFVKAIRERMPANKELSVAVAANPSGLTTYWHGSYDYAGLAQYADYLTIMGYDEYSRNDPKGSGPVASGAWTEKAIKYATERVSPDKIMLTVPLYGRMWSEDGSMKGDAFTLRQIDSLLNQFNCTTEYVTAQQSAKATLIIPAGTEEMKINGVSITPGTYTIWYENEQSLQYKYDLAQQYGLKGVAFWALYGNVEGFWQTFSQWQDEVPMKGWQLVGSSWKYYDDNGVALTGWQTINGETYYFNTSGIMQTGIVTVDGKKYYINSGGALQKGWQKYDGKWYFADDSTAELNTGWINDGGKMYFMNSDCVMQTGWVKDNGKWYYLSNSGAMTTGWQKEGGKWYLLSEAGDMLTGWQKRVGSWYYMSASGAMLTGWYQDGSTWYYLSSSGAMVTGTRSIGGKTYTFDSSGRWIK